MFSTGFLQQEFLKENVEKSHKYHIEVIKPQMNILKAKIADDMNTKIFENTKKCMTRVNVTQTRNLSGIY